MSIARNKPNTQNGASGDFKIMTPAAKVNRPENNVQPQPGNPRNKMALKIRITPATIKIIAQTWVSTIAVFTGVLNA